VNTREKCERSVAEVAAVIGLTGWRRRSFRSKVADRERVVQKLEYGGSENAYETSEFVRGVKPIHHESDEMLDEGINRS
jgi:hypothetical protein